MVVAYEIVEMIVRPAKPFPLLSSYSSYPMCWSIVLLDVSHALHHDSPFDQTSLASRCHSSLPSNDRLSLHHLFRNSLTGVSGVTKMFSFLSSNASSTHVLRDFHFLLAWFQFFRCCSEIQWVCPWFSPRTNLSYACSGVLGKTSSAGLFCWTVSIRVDFHECPSRDYPMGLKLL